MTYLSHKIIRDLFRVENAVDRGRVFALGGIRQHCQAVRRTALIMTPPEIAGRYHSADYQQQHKADDKQHAADTAASPETLAAALALVDVILARDDQQARRWFDRATSEPKEWFDAATVMRSQLVVTPQELTELAASVAQLLHPYTRGRRKDPPPEARRVAAMFRAVPSD